MKLLLKSSKYEIVLGKALMFTVVARCPASVQLSLKFSSIQHNFRNKKNIVKTFKIFSLH